MTETVWRATSGLLTIELSPPGVTPRNPGLFHAIIRLDGANFVNDSGKRIRQTAAIVLSASPAGSTVESLP